jgi:imidazolonepropionase-like amidohydrolase
VLYIATLGSARVMNEDATSGSIAPGKRADMVLIDGDPLERMSDIRRTVLTIKGGTIYDAAALARASGLASPQTTGKKE